jgi:hypothetical protein
MIRPAALSRHRGRRASNKSKAGNKALLISTDLAGVGSGWTPVAGQLFASGVLLLSGFQGMEVRSRMGAAFWFFMGIAFAISALVTSIRGNLIYASAISVVVICSETLLIVRRVLRATSNRNPR